MTNFFIFVGVSTIVYHLMRVLIYIDIGENGRPAKMPLGAPYIKNQNLNRKGENRHAEH